MIKFHLGCSWNKEKEDQGCGYNLQVLHTQPYATELGCCQKLKVVINSILFSDICSQSGRFLIILFEGTQLLLAISQHKKQIRGFFLKT